ncbi:MAG TPA: HAD family hydrolase [Gaiellaceae bacterium]|nr:HAD family hydrolase [Gaiellaceae bacterium]
MLDAVLFDWSNTLVKFTWDDDLLRAGHRAGLGRDDPVFTERYREMVFARKGEDYASLLRELGVDDPDAFIDAEHEVWRPANEVLGAARALLETLRERGFMTALVAKAWPEPERVLRADVKRFGLAELFDAMVFSGNPMDALHELGVEPEAALYVGDTLGSDVQRAADAGMTTIQALWFVAEDNPAGVEPDFQAFTPMDVLNIALRVAR